LKEGIPGEAARIYAGLALNESTPTSTLLDGSQALIAMRMSTEARALLDLVQSRQVQMSEREQTRFLHQSARLNLVQGQLAEAEAAYAGLLQRNPLDGEALLAAGDIIVDRSGPLDQARQYYDRASRVEGFETQGLLRLAQLAARQGDYENAAALVRRVLANDYNPALERYLQQLSRRP
jgi:Flp pilus assembly protein TadD